MSSGFFLLVAAAAATSSSLFLPTLGAQRNFDVIIFAQSWPVTTCIEWKERGESNACIIPPNIWTVHGIWPTKYGTRGPNFCDKSIRFDQSKIQPMLGKLEARWTDVHLNSRQYGFWKHEYEKHGSCAVSVPQLDTPQEYFQQGIQWNKEYPVYQFLADADILPGGEYTWSDIFSAVKSKLGGVNPAIQCEKDDKEGGVKTLYQILICFDPDSLRPVNCDRVAGGLNQGCPKKAPFLYPEQKRSWGQSVVKGKAAEGGRGSAASASSVAFLVASSLLLLASLGLSDEEPPIFESEEVALQSAGNLSYDKADYDLFIFAQSWPDTNCIEWKEKDVNNTCNLPRDMRWTVHGLWPSKKGEIGPSYCDPTAHFDIEKLKPIMADLESRWTNVHRNADEGDFWKHEYLKHGSCAEDNAALDTEFKYFHQGIVLNERFPLVEYLRSAGVVPGSFNSFDRIFQAIRKALSGSNPAIQCQYDHEKRRHTLAQIDICLDKQSLSVINCDEIHGGLNHGCPRQGNEVFYPDIRRVESNSKLWIVFLIIVVVSLAGAAAFAIRQRCVRNRSGYETV